MNPYGPEIREVVLQRRVRQRRHGDLSGREETGRGRPREPVQATETTGGMHVTGEQIGTAEEALGAILDEAQRLGESHWETRDRIIAMVRVALADLHNRPQTPVPPLAFDPEPTPEWRRLQFIDRALKWAELVYPERSVVDLAEEIEAYATGRDTKQGIPNPAARYLLAAEAADAAADRLTERARAGLRTRESASAYQDGIKALRDLADTLREAGSG